MVNSKKQPEKDCRRKSDKQNSINLIVTIASFVILLVFTYVLGNMNNRMSRIEDKQDKFINFYVECKEDINELRREYTENLNKLKDQILELFKKKS
ncbi:MAG: hypothetical protein A2Y62_21170 [Candidatus Fischerbacteria bacterium RBG_13_37_8]|uniref:Uncharacterized protein n=1 Tax=Candidatus Fischerbacteria bacterium RBG_13_37_8 TaxID=1817863 RepID=A0A1F5V4X3_9BACT|nr:MAG: hypothetical protein A2Y62_21170 [Candidatus Fischerbacteria bacterium RBG_13_37_8]